MTDTEAPIEPPLISWIAGEFVDQTVERRFRSTMLPETRRQSRILFFLGAAAGGSFVVADLFIWTHMDPAALGAGILSISASTVALPLASQLRTRLVEPLIVLWQFVISIAFLIAASDHHATAVAFLFLLPAVYYLALPTTFWTTVFASLTSSAVMLLALIAVEAESSESGLLALALSALHLILMPLKSRSGSRARRDWATARAYDDALRELANSRSLLERTFLAVPIPLVVTSLDTGEIVRANASAERFLGVKGELVGRKASSFYHDPDDRKLLTESLRSDDNVAGIRTRVITAGGESRTILISASAVGTDSDGRYMVAAIHDVTDAEEKQQRLLLAESEYRAHFENSVVGIYRSTADGRMLRANPALVKLNGYDREEELISAVNDIASEWYVDAGRREEWMQMIGANGLVTDFVSEVYRHRTRERIWISENGWQVRGPEGDVLYYEGSLVEITERKRLEAEVERMARYDSLTELPNRRYFKDRVERAVASMLQEEEGFALMCVDLDRFKAVNDAFGHSAGDLLLQEAARRLTVSCRQQDVIARVGGDEFTVLLPRIDNRSAAAAIAERIIAEFKRPFALDGPRALVGASIGIVFAPVDGTEQSDLLAKADAALYRAKSEGRSTYRFHDLENSVGPAVLGIRQGKRAPR